MLDDIQQHCKNRKILVGINELSLSLFKQAILVKQNSKRKRTKPQILFYSNQTRFYLSIESEYQLNDEIDYIEFSEKLIQIQTTRNNLIVIALN